ncbi:MAG: hypothetical protein ACREUL_08265 [Steroidobacteraceae bacterium]
MNMKARKRRSGDEHGVRAVTPPGRSVFHDLFPAEEAAELEIRSTLLHGLEHWLANSGMTHESEASMPDGGCEQPVGGRGADRDQC